MYSGEKTVPVGSDVPLVDTAELAALTLELREALAPGLLLLEPLGAGGMGLVFLARDPALKRLVVVKVLAPWLAQDATACARFAREASSAAAVAHPNVVGIFLVGQLPRSGTSYFVMQHVDGPTLEDAFPRGTVTALPRVRRIVGEVAAALSAAHARGLVHRDIKPSNIMLDRDSGRSVVLDFGISAAIPATAPAGPVATKLTAQGSSIGTPQYMSPEQALGEDVTDRSDIYSLGTVAFELAAGRPVFEETTPMALAAAHIKEEPPALDTVRPDVDPAFADLVDRCLAKSPAARPRAEEIARVLLPGAGPQIEWPPPGLERLHGTGAELVRHAAWLSMGLLALMTLLYLQPVMATGAWMRGESSWFWRTVWAPAYLLDGIFLRPIECQMRQGIGGLCAEGLDPAPLWLFGCMVLGVMLAATAILTALTAWRLTRRARAGHRAGYPWPVLLDVAWDGGPETAEILSGNGAYAASTPADRTELLARRQRANAWLIGGALLTGVGPLAWLLGVVRIGDAGASLVTGAELSAVATPLAVSLLVRRRLLARERSLSQRWRRQRAHGAEIQRSLVDGWLTTAAGGRTPSTHPLARLAARLGWALTLAAVAPVTAGAIVFITHASAFLHQPTPRKWQTDWLDYVSLPGSRTTWLRMDSMLTREIARLGSGHPDPGRVVPVPGAPPAARARARLRAINSVYADVWFDRQVADSVWTWLAGWNARVGAAAAWSPWRPTAPPGLLPAPAERLVGPMVLRAAVLALEAGDTGAARARMQQVLTVTRAQLGLARGTLFWDLEEHVALLRGLAEETGDSAGIVAGSELQNLLGPYRWAHRLLGVPGPVYATALMADPEHPTVENHIALATIAPGVRAALAEGSVIGLCSNGREIVLGPSPMRTDLAARARNAVGDLPWVTASLDSLRRAAAEDLSGRGALAIARRMLWCLETYLKLD